MSLTAKLIDFTIRVIQTFGYGGIVLLMALESMIAPIPSEAVMPFVGYLVATGDFNLYVALLASTVGSLIGSLVSYYLGYNGGNPLILRFGKYLFLDVEHLAWTERFFRKYGEKTIFVSRLIPVVRHLISIPAGIGKMHMGKFVLYTAIGATIWNGFLLWIGILLKEHWEQLHVWLKPFDYFVLGLVVAGVLWFVHQHLKRRTRIKLPR